MNCPSLKRGERKTGFTPVKSPIVVKAASVMPSLMHSKVKCRHVDGFYRLKFILCEFKQLIGNLRGRHLFPAPCADFSRSISA